MLDTGSLRTARRTHRSLNMSDSQFHWLLWLATLFPLQSGCDVRAPSAAFVGQSAPNVGSAPSANEKRPVVPTSVSGFESDHDRLMYLFGRQIADSIDRSMTLRPSEIDFVLAGLADRLHGNRSQVALTSYEPALETVLTSRRSEHLLLEKQRAHAYLDDAARDERAQRTKSGLVYTRIAAGSGRSPLSGESVEAQLRLKLDDQTTVDDPRLTGHPVTVTIGHNLPCLTEGLQLMRQGERARLVCPPELAYGDAGQMPNIPGGAAVSFDVELVAVHSSRRLAIRSNRH